MKKKQKRNEDNNYWFTLLPAQKQIDDIVVEKTTLKNLKEIVLKGDSKNHVVNEIETTMNVISSNANKFIWAFNKLEDVVDAIKIMQQPQYKEYSSSISLGEYSLSSTLSIS